MESSQSVTMSANNESKKRQREEKREPTCGPPSEPVKSMEFGTFLRRKETCYASFTYSSGKQGVFFFQNTVHNKTPKTSVYGGKKAQLEELFLLQFTAEEDARDYLRDHKKVKVVAFLPDTVLQTRLDWFEEWRSKAPLDPEYKFTKLVAEDEDE